MKGKIFTAAVVIAIAAFPVLANVSFESLDLNGEDQLLFTAKHEIPGTPVYQSLFMTRLGKNKTEDSPKIMTCFPEQMELLNGGKTLQLRNRYGTAWYDTNSRSLSWITSANRIPVEYTHTGVVSESPDGKWICFVRQTKNALGQLVLQNVLTQEQQVIVESTAFSYEKVPVKWAKDSACFLYEKNTSVYFLTPDAAFKNVQLPEEYRKIGKGTISCVEWTDRNELLYIDSDIIYRIRENELYTRGLYAALVGSGTIVGRLPAKFSPLRDRFWVSPDGQNLVLVTGDNLVSFYSIVTTGYDFVKINSIFPLNTIKGSPLDFDVYWTSEKKPVMWIALLNYSSGRKSSSVYRIGSSMELLLDVMSSAKPQLSPDKKQVAFTGGNSIYVYDVDSWKQVNRLSGESVISFVWASPSLLYVGGSKSVRLWNTDPLSASESVLFLTSVDEAYWSGGRVVARYGSENNYYAYEPLKNVWNKMSSQPEAELLHSEKNGRFRVFTGSAQNKRYRNAIYVRSLSRNVITYPVFPETDLVTPAPKKVAFAFDAMDNAEGLARVLYVIDEFDVPATFFLNGEFIRRYPTETNQIVSSGAECASSFYSTADLTEKHFVIDENFIKRGLARNEDEFFAATKHELSLLWHAPWYKDTPLMKRSGSDAGYRYVSAFTKYSDTSSFEGSARNVKTPYYDAGQIIDLLVGSLTDGMVIPVNVGKGYGTRQDYLFEKLDLLVSAILDSGYEIVSLREVVEE